MVVDIDMFGFDLFVKEVVNMCVLSKVCFVCASQI